MPACFQALTRELFLSFVPRYDLVCELNMHRYGCRACETRAKAACLIFVLALFPDSAVLFCPLFLCAPPFFLLNPLLCRRPLFAVSLKAVCVALHHVLDFCSLSLSLSRCDLLHVVVDVSQSCWLLVVFRDGEKLADPFGQNKGTFRYASIARSIKRVAAMLEEEGAAAAAPAGSEEGPSRPEQEEVARSTQHSVDAAAGGGGDGGGGGGGGESGADAVPPPSGAKGHGDSSAVRQVKEGAGDDGDGDGRSAFR